MKLLSYLKPTVTFAVLYVLVTLIIVAINTLLNFHHAALSTTAILSSAIGAAYVFIRLECRLPTMKEALILSALSMLVFWGVLAVLIYISGFPFILSVFVAQTETALVFIGIVYVYAARHFLGDAFLNKVKGIS